VAPDEAVPEESFAIVAVTIFDGEGFRADQYVWVEDGRIRAVGQALHLPDGLARVDGRGRALMAGLSDSHVHTFSTTLNDAFRFGVTSVLDQFTDPALAASERAARAPGPRRGSGPCQRRHAGDRCGRARHAVRHGHDGRAGARARRGDLGARGARDHAGLRLRGSDRRQLRGRVAGDGGSDTRRLVHRQPVGAGGAAAGEGEVVSGAFAFPWSGAIYFPGPQPMQPVDFSGREVLGFRTRGDGRTYVVMLFDGSDAGVLPSVPFTAPEVWTHVEIPLAGFPTATPGLIGGLSSVASIVPGNAYAFELDDVEIR